MPPTPQRMLVFVHWRDGARERSGQYELSPTMTFAEILDLLKSSLDLQAVFGDATLDVFVADRANPALPTHKLPLEQRLGEARLGPGAHLWLMPRAPQIVPARCVLTLPQGAEAVVSAPHSLVISREWLLLALELFDDDLHAEEVNAVSYGTSPLLRVSRKASGGHCTLSWRDESLVVTAHSRAILLNEQVIQSQQSAPVTGRATLSFGQFQLELTLYPQQQLPA